MNGILIAVLIVTGLLIYKIISSSRKQEGYKRWKAGNRSNTEDATDTETTRKGWFSRWFGASASTVIPWFDAEAVAKCSKGDTERYSRTLPGILDWQKKGRLPYDFSTGQRAESYSKCY